AAGLAKARHLTRLSGVNNRLSPNPIEPRAAIARIDPPDERLPLITATPAPHRPRSHLPAALGLPGNPPRGIARRVGRGVRIERFAVPRGGARAVGGAAYGSCREMDRRAQREPGGGCARPRYDYHRRDGV